jgi:pimeloyl-ACP methyl ester carboxylesterase
VGAKADIALTAQVNKINELMGMPVPISVETYRKNVAAAGSTWMDWFIDYDPEADIKAVKCPVMAVNGSKDVQVLPELNLSGIERNLRENKKNIIREYPDLNHLFQKCRTGLPQEYSTIEETFNEQVLKDIASWVNSL